MPLRLRTEATQNATETQLPLAQSSALYLNLHLQYSWSCSVLSKNKIGTRQELTLALAHLPVFDLLTLLLKPYVVFYQSTQLLNLKFHDLRSIKIENSFCDTCAYCTTPTHVVGIKTFLYCYLYSKDTVASSTPRRGTQRCTLLSSPRSETPFGSS